MDKPTLRLGSRVRIKRIWIRNKGEHGGETGVIVAMPGMHGGPVLLYAVQLDGETDDDRKYRAVAGDGLELLDDADDQGR